MHLNGEISEEDYQRHNGSALLTPSIKDILIGDCERFRNHLGNLRMNKTVQMYMEMFVAQRDQTKGKLVILAKAIYRDIARGGARFVKPLMKDDDREWIEATKMEGLRKIGQAIREGPKEVPKKSSRNAIPPV